MLTLRLPGVGWATGGGAGAGATSGGGGAAGAVAAGGCAQANSTPDNIPDTNREAVLPFIALLPCKEDLYPHASSRLRHRSRFNCLDKRYQNSAALIDIDQWRKAVHAQQFTRTSGLRVLSVWASAMRSTRGRHWPPSRPKLEANSGQIHRARP